MHFSLLTVLAILVLIHSAAHADAPADTGQSIHVNSIRNPELKSYRVMTAGLDAFDEYHALAPKAREAFVLSQLEGLTYAAIAERLQTSERTVKRYMQQGFERCLALVA